MEKVLRFVVLPMVASYLLGAVLLYIFQRDLLYIESPEYQHDLKSLEFENDGETLKVVVLNPNRAKAIIYFGGNAEAVIFNEKPFSEKHTGISLIGRSLGTGIASYLASKRPVESLALVTPYDSIQRVAQQRFRIYPMSYLLLDKYDSLSRASSISAKVLIIMAELDTIIPNPHSIRLKNGFSNDQVSIIKIVGADHNNLSIRPEYYSKLKEFLASP